MALVLKARGNGLAIQKYFYEVGSVELYVHGLFYWAVYIGKRIPHLRASRISKSIEHTYKVIG